MVTTTRRTIIRLSDEDKAWLDRQARARQVSMTELVRRAVRAYRKHHDHGTPGRLQELPEQTRGGWAHGGGLRHQDAVRDEWERRG